MKYNDPIVLQENEVHTMILKKIKRGSRILEFGAASGRMTKIMKEQYDCEVYIVEYEREAFEVAKQYAVDGICGDIEQYKWKKWKNIKFDYIVITDVLEHLPNPDTVLMETAEVLKDDGSVLTSIPNIAHNDILIKLYQNRFEYTDIGLLDDTHIHFFAEKSLKKFVEDAGFVIYTKEYKTVLTGMTEQCREEKLAIPKLLRSALQERKNGEVYQFVLELKKRGTVVAPKDEEVLYSNIHGTVYFDRGNGYIQEDTKDVIGHRSGEQIYSFEFDFPVNSDIQHIRFDPIEDSIVTILNVESEVADLEIPLCEQQGKGYVVYSEDPQLIWKVPQNLQTFHAKVEIKINEPMGVTFVLDKMQKESNERAELLDLKQKHEKYIGELEQSCKRNWDDLQQANIQRQLVEQQLSASEERCQQYHHELKQADQEKQRLQREAQNCKLELERIYATKIWKLGEKLHHIKRKVKR